MKRPEKKHREALAHFYSSCVSTLCKKGFGWTEANQSVRAIWNEECDLKASKSLPGIIGQDGFLRMYALDVPLSQEMADRINARLQIVPGQKLNPIHIEWNYDSASYYDIDATPPGILAKLFPGYRLKTDEKLLKCIAHDLERIAEVDNPERRCFLTLAVLSHSAAYRELQGRYLNLPSFEKKGELVTYFFLQHLIAEGVKTLSLVPLNSNQRGIYLCQGTELWPSQPSMLGSMLSNFAAHGAATEAYAHSWRRIHKHLRDLNKHGKLPFVCGHSMGGSLAIQIGLYAHDLIESSYAFNPPMPNERDYSFYSQMSKNERDKIIVTANIDDFAFWRIGAKVIGKVTLFLGKERWRYYPVSLTDCLCVFPACYKFILNVRHAFPAHQHVTALSSHFIYVTLTDEEIERENLERVTRFDYLSFFPKLYDPMKTFLNWARRVFKWRLEEEFIHNEIEIINLHQNELLDMLTEENREKIEHELKVLRRQKESLQARLRQSSKESDIS